MVAALPRSFIFVHILGSGTRRAIGGTSGGPHTAGCLTHEGPTTWLLARGMIPAHEGELGVAPGQSSAAARFLRDAYLPFGRGLQHPPRQ
jgi:hypothetical protein